ncbi:MAG: hypothetical protein R3A50_18460 [Saprospiraceae bacterium]
MPKHIEQTSQALQQQKKIRDELAKQLKIKKINAEWEKEKNCPKGTSTDPPGDGTNFTHELYTSVYGLNSNKGSLREEQMYKAFPKLQVSYSNNFLRTSQIFLKRLYFMRIRFRQADPGILTLELVWYTR